MGTGLKFLSYEEGVIMNQGTNLGSQIGRWIILAALVALLGALLLTIRPVGAQETGLVGSPPPSNVNYGVEHEGTNRMFTVLGSAGDTGERLPIFWTLTGLRDASNFEIEGTWHPQTYGCT